MLSNHKTQFRFDDYTSGPIELNNRTIQGCPLSMLIYTSYNADLINIAKGKCKLSTRFVDDYIFVATGNNIQDTHQTLKNMMERVEGSLDWLHNHTLKICLHGLFKTQHLLYNLLLIITT